MLSDYDDLCDIGSCLKTAELCNYSPPPAWRYRIARHFKQDIHYTEFTETAMLPVRFLFAHIR